MLHYVLCTPAYPEPNEHQISCVFFIVCPGSKKGIQILVGNSLAPGTPSLDHPGPKPNVLNLSP